MHTIATEGFAGQSACRGNSNPKSSYTHRVCRANVIRTRDGAGAFRGCEGCVLNAAPAGCNVCKPVGVSTWPRHQCASKPSPPHHKVGGGACRTRANRRCAGVLAHLVCRCRIIGVRLSRKSLGLDPQAIEPLTGEDDGTGHSVQLWWARARQETCFCRYRNPWASQHTNRRSSLE